MSQRSSGSAGPGGDGWPDELWPGGDQVSAQIVQNGGAASATAIQDPAQSPAGGTAP